VTVNAVQTLVLEQMYASINPSQERLIFGGPSCSFLTYSKFILIITTSSSSSSSYV